MEFQLHHETAPVDTSRLKFRKDRQTGIGGSDVAAIMGLSPWQTPLDIYLDKTTPIDESELDEETNEFFIRGNVAEKYIIERYEISKGVRCLKDLPMLRDAKNDFLIGHADAKVEDKNIYVEAKTVAGYSNLWREGIPPYYRTQVALYASITDCDKIDVAAMFDRWHMETFTYYRDLDFEETVRKYAINFWYSHVLKRIPPEPINKEDSKTLYPRAQRGTIRATEEMKTAVRSLSYYKGQKQLLESQINNAEAYIMKEMQDNEILEDENGSSLITWKNSSMERLDQSEVKKRDPELYALCKKTICSRKFIVC